MTVRTVNTLPAATHDERVRCLFAIELSKQSWVIGFNTPLSAKISRRILSGGDWKGLLGLIEEVRARVSRAMDRAVEVMSCYEAGYDGFWLHRQLEAHGVRNYVIDPASLQVDRRVRREGGDDGAPRVASCRRAAAGSAGPTANRWGYSAAGPGGEPPCGSSASAGGSSDKGSGLTHSASPCATSLRACSSVTVFGLVRAVASSAMVSTLPP
jgi:hypothetical protein